MISKAASSGLHSSVAFRFGAKGQRYALTDRRSEIYDVLLVMMVFMAMLFNKFLGPLTPLTVLAVTPAFILLRYERLFPVLARVWPLLLLPLLALLSTTWSEVPMRTLRYAFLYFMTVFAAVLIGAGCGRQALIKGMLLSFAAYIALSLPFGNWHVWGGSGGRAFAGFMGSKNASGDASALSLIIGCVGFFWAVSEKRWMWAAVALGLLPLALLSLYLSKATGALVACLVALPCLILWTLSRRLESMYRNLIFAVSTLAVGLALATIQIWMPPVFEFVLEASGKDADLTGRSLLWTTADRLITEKPWLGLGYDAFWVHNNLEAEYLWREMGIKNRRGFNFHNTPRDILVSLGIVGLAIFVMAFLYSASRLLLNTMARPEYCGLLFSTLLIFESPRLWFEMIGFSNMQFATLIFFVTLSYGIRPLQTRSVGQPALR